MGSDNGPWEDLPDYEFPKGSELARELLGDPPLELLLLHIHSASTRWFKVGAAFGDWAWRGHDVESSEWYPTLWEPLRWLASSVSVIMSDLQRRRINRRYWKSH